MATNTLYSKYGIREVCDVSFINLATGKMDFYLDSLKMSSMDMKATTKYAIGGKGGTRLLGFDFDREPTFKVQDALMRPEAIAALAGTALDKDATAGATVFKREVLTFDATGALNLTETPVAQGNGAPLVSLYLNDSGDGYSQDSEITYAGTSGTASATEYTVTAKAVTTAVGNANKTAIVGYWFVSSNGHQTVNFTSANFPGYYQIVGDTVAKNLSTGNDEPYQIVIAKAKLNPNFSMALTTDGDPATFEFDLDVFKPTVGTTMVQLIKY